MASAAAAATTTAVVLKEAKQSTQLAAGAAKQSTQLAAGAAAAVTEVVCAKCDCCGLTEECTVAYIDRVRERFGGRWICGLCSEAVKDYGDSGSTEKHDVNDDDGDGDGDDELDSLKQHMKFCQQFRSSTPPVNPTQDLISAVKNLLRRTLDSPRKRKGSVFPSSSASSVTESD